MRRYAPPPVAVTESAPIWVVYYPRPTRGEAGAAVTEAL
jgi:hypothetical protein